MFIIAENMAEFPKKRADELLNNVFYSVHYPFTTLCFAVGRMRHGIGSALKNGAMATSKPV